MGRLSEAQVGCRSSQFCPSLLDTARNFSSILSSVGQKGRIVRLEISSLEMLTSACQAAVTPVSRRQASGSLLQSLYQSLMLTTAIGLLSPVGRD